MPLPRRLRDCLRFRLRTLFVLLTIGCLWLGWNVRIVNQRRDMLGDIRSRGAETIEWMANGGVVVFSDSEISWTRQLLGDLNIAFVYLPSAEFSSYEAQRIQDVFPEAVLLPGPFGMQATNSNLEH